MTGPAVDVAVEELTNVVVDESSAESSYSSSSSTSVSTSTSSQSSSFSTFFYRGRIAHPKRTIQQHQPSHLTQTQSNLVRKAASFDPSSSSSSEQLAVPCRPVRSWPIHRIDRDWRRQNNTTSSSTLLSSVSSSDDELEDAFRLNPLQQRRREDKKVQRLVQLAKQQRTIKILEAEAGKRNVVEREGATANTATKATPVARPSRDLIIPVVAVKPILDIPVEPVARGPVDIDTGYPWMDDPEALEDEHSILSSVFSTCTPTTLKRDAASFESDETRRISNKSRKLPWTPPPTLARDLEKAFTGLDRSPTEAPADFKTKPFWTKKSTLAAIVALILLVVAIVSLSMVFVGQKRQDDASNQTPHQGSTFKRTIYPTPSPSLSPTVTHGAAQHKPTHNISASVFTPKHTPPTNTPHPKSTRSPTFSPSLNPSLLPSIHPTTAFAAAVWQQRGQTIQGTQNRMLLGSTIALSSNGQVLAVGASNYTVGNSTESGRVQVFQWGTSDQWTPRGQVLLGQSPRSQFGLAAALNHDGTVLAISEPTLGVGQLYRLGNVKTFRWHSSRTVWIETGEIVGLDKSDYFGLSLALSGDGTRLAVGSPYHASTKGQVRIFDYNGTGWQLLTSLDGTSPSDWFGWDVALSTDGNLVAIGAPHNSDHGGYVRCFSSRINASSWSQVGADIVIEDFAGSTSSHKDFFGNSVSLSTWNGGNYLAIGAPLRLLSGSSVGFSAVYKLQTAPDPARQQQHTLLGRPLFGSAAKDRFGYVVRLLNGHLAVSSPGSNNGQGQVEFYRWTGYDWESRNTPLTSSSILSSSSSSPPGFGLAVALAQQDNQTLVMAVGAPSATRPRSTRQSVGAAQVYTTDGLS